MLDDSRSTHIDFSSTNALPIIYKFLLYFGFSTNSLCILFLFSIVFFSFIDLILCFDFSFFFIFFYLLILLEDLIISYDFLFNFIDCKVNILKTINVLEKHITWPLERKIRVLKQNFNIAIQFLVASIIIVFLFISVQKIMDLDLLTVKELR